MPRATAANRIRRPLALVALFSLAAVAGCQRRIAAPRPPVSVPPPSRPGSRSRTARGRYVLGHWTQKGIASWYGVPYDGRRAADGEIYDMYKMVAAHRTLPFNSLVRVTDLKNGRQVVVRIIDRGPFVKGRIIDLSFAAARKLDMVEAGIAPVRLQLVSGRNPDVGDFTVQVGAFALLRNAERLRNRLRKHWGPIFIEPYHSPRGLLYRVRVGDAPTEPAARRLADRLRRKAGFRTTYVVRIDR